MVAGGCEVVGDDDALARREAVVLDHVRSAEGVEGFVDLRGGGADVAAGGGDTGPGHDVLGERLGAFELGGFAGGAEAGDAGRAHGVGDPGDERRLRADDHQLGAQFGREARDGVTVERVDRVQFGHLCDAGVAGGAVQSGDIGVEGQRAAQGVFAGAAADDEDLHGVQPSRRGRRARTAAGPWTAARPGEGRSAAWLVGGRSACGRRLGRWAAARAGGRPLAS